jgi:tryptophan-rich sensory protein
LAAFIGSMATIDAVSTANGWYATLIKPPFNPPKWVFGPVWSVLYTMMGVCFYLINRSNHPKKRLFQQVFIAQLVLNALWSILFFYFHALGWAALEIIVLWAVLLWLTIKSKTINPWCRWLMIPYLLWVSFAAVLSVSIWWGN